MRIAIDGAQSTGKTTLIKALAERLGGLKYLEETSRAISHKYGIQCSADWLTLIAQTSAYTDFLADAISTHQVREQGDFVIDTSLFGLLSYAQLSDVRRFDWIYSNANYDLIVYCPIEFDFEDDGFRYLARRSDLDALLFNNIRDHHRGGFLRVSGLIEDRIAAFVAHLKMYEGN